jgi:threonine aldolase
MTEEAELEWWKAPDDEDVMDGADLMQLLGSELEALIRDNEAEVYAYTTMLAHPANDSEKARIRNERWLEYHQARVRQLKHVHARAMTRKLPEATET